MRQVDVVGFANVTVLWNIMNYHLDCFHLAREGIQAQMRQVDAVGFVHMMVL
jgi:hypothetical protein